MANTKTGLSYYTVDCDRYQDRRIKRLKKDFNCIGPAVYDYILCEIYRVQGCFLAWDDNTAFDVAEYFGLKESTVHEVVRYCASVGLFDKELLLRGIITSASIQRRYMEMCTRARRKNIVIPEAYRLHETEAETQVEANEEAAETENTLQGVKPDCSPYALTLSQEIEALRCDECWLDQLQVVHRMPVSALRQSLDDFRIQCIADGKNSHQSLQDAKSHFNNWLRIVNDKNRKKDDKNRNTLTSKQEANSYAMQQYLSERQRLAKGIHDEVPKPF